MGNDVSVELKKQYQQTGLYYLHGDHLGTATFVTDSNANPTQFFLNLPFGETMVEQMSGVYDNPYKFNAKELDSETGLYYYGARYYNPRLSIWYGVDPLAEETMEPYAYAYNNPIRIIDPTGMQGEDWVKNNKSRKYEWKNEVTKPSETPKGYSYVGKEDTDIVKDLFGGTSFSSRTNDFGSISSDDYDNPYSSKGAALTPANFTSTMTVSLGADVATTYDKAGNIANKEFNGVNITTSISGTNTAQSTADIKLSGEKMTLQGNQMSSLKLSQGGTIGIGGDMKTLNYNTYWNANSIQKNFGRSYNLDFKFKGQYYNGSTPLGYMSAGFVVPNKTNLNLSVKFGNGIIRKTLQ